MSKAAKQSILILVVLLIGSLVFAGLTVMQKQEVENELSGVVEQLKDSKKTASAATSQAKKFKEDLDLTKANADKIEKKLKKADEQIEGFLKQIESISDEKESFKAQVDTINKEKFDLIAKVNELNQKISSNPLSTYSQSSLKNEVTQPIAGTSDSTETSVQAKVNVPISENDEAYWASVLRDKASLEVKMNEYEDKLSQKSLEIVELKQNNKDLQIEIDSLSAARDEIVQEIKYKSDLVNNLSLELARTKNDKKFVSDRLNKSNEENVELRQELKQLAGTKSALEKSIVKLSQDKNKISKELGQTESIIQSKIDEIWEIKDSIDETIKTSKFMVPSNEVELPPIHINSGGSAVQFDLKPTDTGYNGKIVSVNEQNNFAIVNIGEMTGVSIGDNLSVYRDTKYIARLEVIQVRKDISAADIKDQWAKLQVGDEVR